MGRPGNTGRPIALSHRGNPHEKNLLLAGAAALIASPAVAPALADLAGELTIGQTHAGMAATQTDIDMVHMHLQHAAELPGRPHRRRL